VSFSIESRAAAVGISLDVPAHPRPRTVRLRVRLPRPARITGVSLDGMPYSRFDHRTETIDLSGRGGRITLEVRHAPR
jgi:hypothetical protein